MFKHQHRSNTSACQRLAWRWTQSLQRGAWPIVILYLVLAAISAYYALHNLGVDTDTNKMLSAELPFQRDYEQYRQAFPDTTDTLVVVIEAATPDRASEAASQLTNALRGYPGIFTQVYRPYGGEFLEQQALLYLEPDRLQALADRLAEVQPFLGSLSNDPSLYGLFDMLVAALEAVQDGEALDLSPLLEKIDEAMQARLAHRYYQLSWQTLIQGDSQPAGQHKQLIVLRPRLDYTQLQPAARAIHRVRETAAALGLRPERGVTLRMTGEVALAHEELETASRGALFTGLLSLVLVAGVLTAGLRAWQLIAASILTLVTGLIFTAGFAALTLGKLNLISIAFAVLYIGLGIDYSIHWSLRHRELREQGLDAGTALMTTLRDIGGSLTICTVTTAIGFYAFIPTAFAGVSELGLIAGTGMIISLLLNLSLLPALLCLMPDYTPKPRATEARLSLSRLLRPVTTQPRMVLWLSLGLTLLAASLLPRVGFDFNPLHLRDQNSESVVTFKQLLDDNEASPWVVTSLVDDAGQARQQAQQLEQLDAVKRVVFLDTFVPRQQAQKLAILQDLALIMGTETAIARQPPAHSRRDTVDAMQQLLSALGTVSDRDPALKQAASRLKTGLRQYLDSLAALPPKAQDQQLAALQDSLLHSLPAQLDRLATALQAQPFDQRGLPAELRRRWVSERGQYRLEIFPSRPLTNDADLRAFVTAVQSVAPKATDTAVISLEASKVVSRAFIQALLTALAAITLLLLALLPEKRDVPLVLVPLLLSALFTCALSVLLHLPFNYANVIALPLLLGVGVDSGIHMVHRFRTALPANGDLLSSSTARAILFSALTTVCSFGSLAFSPHPGAASMGKMLTTGITSTLLCMLVVLPALLYVQQGALNAKHR